MIIGKAKTKLKFSFNGYEFNLKPKEKLLFADDVFQLLPQNLQTQFEKAHSVLPPFYEGQDLNGKTLLVFAQAAIGDALCMTPALREIKKRYPKMKLWVCISGKARPVLEGLPYIDKLLPHPAPIKEVVKADYMIKAVEMVGKPQFDNMNMVQYFLWKFCLYFTENETPDVVVDEKIKKEIEEVITQIKEVSGKKKILLFHYLASSIHRTLPPRLLKDIEDLIWNEYVPIICSLPEEDITVEVALDVYGIRAANLSSFMKDIRYLIAAVSLADAIITADTATVHIAAGLKKPTVLISGAIEPELRCGTYPSVIPLRPNYRGQTCVSPCMIHATQTPCKEAQIKRQFYSPCLESIPPKVVYFALKDAELACEKDYPKPKKCPLCGYEGNFSLFEVINQHRIFECPSCNLQFTYPLKTMNHDKAYKKEVKDLLNISNMNYNWAKIVLPEEEIKKWEKVPRFNVLLPILSVIPKGKLFDVGCDSGNFLLLARKRGFEVYGMESSEEAVKIAREKFGLNVAKALTFDELPEEFKGPYKIITAFEVLEHVNNPYKFLKDIYSMLEDNGFLLLSCPHFYKFENMALGYRKYKWWGDDFPPHRITRWKPWTLFYALKYIGFSEVFIFTEPLIPKKVLEGINLRDVEIRQQDGLNFIIPKNITSLIVLDTLKFLYFNSRFLGNYLYALATKGKIHNNWEKIIKRAIHYSAAEIIWEKENEI